jgi:hypothetical protein
MACAMGTTPCVTVEVRDEGCISSTAIGRISLPLAPLLCAPRCVIERMCTLHSVGSNGQGEHGTLWVRLVFVPDDDVSLPQGGTVAVGPADAVVLEVSSAELLHQMADPGHGNALQTNPQYITYMHAPAHTHTQVTARGQGGYVCSHKMQSYARTHSHYILCALPWQMG